MRQKWAAKLVLFVASGMFFLVLLSVGGNVWATPTMSGLYQTVPTLTPSVTPLPTQPKASPTPPPTTPETPPPSPEPSDTPAPTITPQTPFPTPTQPTTPETPQPSPEPSDTPVPPTTPETPWPSPEPSGTPAPPTTPETPPPSPQPAPSPSTTPTPGASHTPGAPSPTPMGTALPSATPKHLGSPTPTPTPVRHVLIPSHSRTIWSGQGDVKVYVPVGAVKGDVSLVLIPHRLEEVPQARAGVLVLGHAFTLAAEDRWGRPLSQLECPFVLQVFCGWVDLRMGGGNPENLYLASWNPSSGLWQPLETESQWEGGKGVLSAETARLGLFAVLTTIPTEVPPTGQDFPWHLVAWSVALVALGWPMKSLVQDIRQG